MTIDLLGLLKGTLKNGFNTAKDYWNEIKKPQPWPFEDHKVQSIPWHPLSKLGHK